MNTRKRPSSRSKEEQDARELPFHIVMAENGEPSDASKLKLTGRLKRDYLSKRHRLIQLCRAVGDRESETFWCGATAVELSLLSCCEIPKPQSRCEDYVVPGALNRAMIPKFVGIVAVDCFELSDRALALAILERTWEADEEAKELVEAYNSKDGEAVSLSSPTARKAAKFNDGGSPTSSEYRTMAKVGIDGKADRLLTFFSGGGLRILNQWLIDASTPVFHAPPKPAPGEEPSPGRPKRTPPSEMWKPSKTGHLLLPLLVLLTFSPFDKDLVTDSKINKQIAKLSKVTDAMVSEAQQNSRKIDLATYTDPKVGGLLVKDVQKSLNDLKASWRAKEKQKEEATSTTITVTTTTTTTIDPFARIKAALMNQLEKAKRYDQDDSAEKPRWLRQVEESKTTNEALPRKERASTEELAKLERDKERQEHLKGDLKKAAAERIKLLEKLRLLKQKKQTQTPLPNANAARPPNGKTVRWKDGFHSSSSGTLRDLLEQVFVFHT